MNLIYRMMGARIGAGAYIDSPIFVDMHILDIGKRCIVQGLADPHGPSSSEWAMKFGFVKMGDYCILEK